MKTTYVKILALLAGFGLVACEKDNFEPPKSAFEGKIVYKGEPLLNAMRQQQRCEQQL